MTCDEIKPLLSEYIDLALDGERSKDAAIHLSQCRGCAKELALLRAVGGLLRELKSRPLPAAFMARLSAKRAAQTSPGALVFRFAGVAFAAVVVGLVVVRNVRQVPPPRGPAIVQPLAEVAQTPATRTRSAPFRDDGAPLPQDDKALPERPLLPSPAEGNPAYTPVRAQSFDNAKQAKKMKAESEELGLQGVGTGAEPPQREPFLGRRLGSPDVRARGDANVQQLIAMRHAIEEASGRPKPVPISGQTAPVLYDHDKDQGNGRSVEEAAGAGSWQGDFSGGNEGTRTVNDAASWKKLWGSLSASVPLPAVDFGRQEVVAVFLGERPTGAYSVEIADISSNESSVTVRWREKIPTPGVPPPEGTTTPYALRAISKSDLPVRFEKAP